jgi:hypothetical protein
MNRMARRLRYLMVVFGSLHCLRILTAFCFEMEAKGLSFLRSRVFFSFMFLNFTTGASIMTRSKSGMLSWKHATVEYSYQAVRRKPTSLFPGNP